MRRRCLLGHRWEWYDSHPYEVGRGYETAIVYEECRRCGMQRAEGEGSVLLPLMPRLPRPAQRVGMWAATPTRGVHSSD